MRRPMTLFEAILIAIIGVILGSVFTFGMRAWNGPIERDACAVVDTEFVSYRKIIQRNHVKEIAVDCADGSRFFVDGSCLSDELTDMLDQLEDGEKIRILTRPDSSTVRELTAGNMVLLAFDDSTRKLASEAEDFCYVGVFMYFLAAVSVINILRIVGIVDLLRVAISVKKRK